MTGTNASSGTTAITPMGLRAENSQETARSFREAVIAAYNGRCAISRLEEPLLLDAAHIMADKDERFGHPVIPNGLPMSKIHHAAFDAHLIGIDPDYRLHVSERLLVQKDGPMLEALKRLKGETIRLPSRRRDYPDAGRWRCGGVAARGAGAAGRAHAAGRPAHQSRSRGPGRPRPYRGASTRTIRTGLARGPIIADRHPLGCR